MEDSVQFCKYKQDVMCKGNYSSDFITILFKEFSNIVQSICSYAVARYSISIYYICNPPTRWCSDRC